MTNTNKHIHEFGEKFRYCSYHACVELRMPPKNDSHIEASMKDIQDYLVEAIVSVERETLEKVKVGAIPATTEYANGWNDCRKAYYQAKKDTMASQDTQEEDNGNLNGNTDKEQCNCNPPKGRGLAKHALNCREVSQ